MLLKNTLLCFMFVGLSFGENVNTLIKYKENEKITKVDNGDLFISVVTYEDHYGHRVYVYNKSGEEIFQLDKTEFPVSRAFISRENNLILNFHRGEYEDGLVKCIDISSRKVVWQTTLNAEDYSISNNREKILTRVQPLMKAGTFEVLNLRDGSKQTIGVNYNNYLAEWLDNEKIVFVKSTRIIKKKNPEYRPTKKDTIHEINLLITQLRDSVKQGRIDNIEYSSKIEKLSKKKKQLIIEKDIPDLNQKSNTVNGTRKRGRTRINPFLTTKVYSILVYNTTKDSIEKQKELVIDNEFIKVLPYDSDVFRIIVNPNKDIYISAYLNNQRVLLRYDSSSLELISLFEIAEYERLIKYSMNGKVFFLAKRKNESFFVFDENQNVRRKLKSEDEQYKIEDIYHHRISEYEDNKIYEINKSRDEINFFNVN